MGAAGTRLTALPTDAQAMVAPTTGRIPHTLAMLGAALELVVQVTPPTALLTAALGMVALDMGVQALPRVAALATLSTSE